ncbi:hypothetical protein FH972_023868 [Carpinus fangiana]|uniref:TIP41-like protein n=1 Tax=Carpinus fangiana TaxID=176857 RepID=A0A5N6KWF0_9ROSI|nr:hypothetical protein FH972_023868 [Carpinus fangiana]
MAANGGLHEPFPGTAASPPNTFRHREFKIETQKLPILKAGPIDEMTKNLGIAPPEMIFGDNYVLIEHEPTGWTIKFNAFDALDKVDKTGQAMLQVAHSGEWKKSREHHHEGIKEVVKPFDWSYTTDYKGTTSAEPQFQPSTTPIPLGLLRRPDPIRFFDEVMLYEDELADNGMSMLSCKIRVMPDRLLLLVRLFMRLDGVMCRIRDTRVFVEFGTKEVIREYTAKEEQYEILRQKLAMTREDVPASLRDANKLSELVPVVEKTLERVQLP